MVFPSHWRYQFISQILANPGGVGDCSEISSKRFYKTLLWIGLEKLNDTYEEFSIS